MDVCFNTDTHELCYINDVQKFTNIISHHDSWKFRSILVKGVKQITNKGNCVFIVFKDILKRTIDQVLVTILIANHKNYFVVLFTCMAMKWNNSELFVQFHSNLID